MDYEWRRVYFYLKVLISSTIVRDLLRVETYKVLPGSNISVKTWCIALVLLLIGKPLSLPICDLIFVSFNNNPPSFNVAEQGKVSPLHMKQQKKKNLLQTNKSQTLPPS